MTDGGRMCYPGVGAANFFRDFRMEFGQSFDMGLIDHGTVIRHLWLFITFPVKRIIDHYTFRNKGAAVGGAEAQVFFLVADLVPEQRVIPVDRSRNRFRIWIDQKLVRVEAMS